MRTLLSVLRAVPSFLEERFAAWAEAFLGDDPDNREWRG